VASSSNWDTSGSLRFLLATNSIGTAVISVTVSDGQPINNLIIRSFNVTVTNSNHQPIAGADSADTYQGTPLNLSTAALLANDSDADFGTVLTITDVSSFSSAGGSVILFDNTISYTPPSNFAGSDTFSYTVSDAEGGEANGFVTIRIWPPLTIGSVEHLSDGSIRIRFQGIPAKTYGVEAAEDLSHWTHIGMALESNSGEFEFDDSADGITMRFYRLRAF